MWTDEDLEQIREAVSEGQRLTRRRAQQVRDHLQQMSTPSARAELGESRYSTAESQRNATRRVSAEREGELSLESDGMADQQGTPVDNPVGAVGGNPNSTFHLNSPVENQPVHELIRRRNVSRELEEAGLSPVIGAVGGARPRVPRVTDLRGLGEFVSRIEGSRTVSPRRAINASTEMGQRLLSRVEREHEDEGDRNAQRHYDVLLCHTQSQFERQLDEERTYWGDRTRDTNNEMELLRQQMEQMRMQSQQQQQQYQQQLQQIQQLAQNAAQQQPQPPQQPQQPQQPPQQP